MANFLSIERSFLTTKNFVFFSCAECFARTNKCCRLLQEFDSDRSFNSRILQKCILSGHNWPDQAEKSSVIFARIIVLEECLQLS